MQKLLKQSMNIISQDSVQDSLYDIFEKIKHSFLKCNISF